MKRKTLIVLGLVGIISISGCGGCSKNEASTEPTEVVMETETESNDATKLHDSESVSDSTIVEESTNGSLDVDITEDNTIFNPDKVGKRGDQFWFEDQATVDYLMGISGVSELPEEQLNQFMSDIAELVSIDEFGDDIGKIEDYIQTVLPVYQEQSSTTKNNNSSNTDTKVNSNSSSAKSNTNNTQQEVQTPNNSSSESNTDNNTNYSESQDINNNQVGTGDQYFFQDEGADWGEYDSNAPSANWQY